MDLRIPALTMLVLLAAACTGDVEEVDRSAIASEVAEIWTQTKIETAASEIVDAVKQAPLVSEQLDKLPALAGERVEEAVANEIAKRVSVTLSAPKEINGVRYQVTALLKMTLVVDLPVVKQRIYLVAAPINLEIDTDTRAVTGWAVNLAEVDVGIQSRTERYGAGMLLALGLHASMSAAR